MYVLGRLLSLIQESKKVLSPPFLDLEHAKGSLSNFYLNQFEKDDDVETVAYGLDDVEDDMQDCLMSSKGDDRPLDYTLKNLNLMLGIQNEVLDLSQNEALDLSVKKRKTSSNLRSLFEPEKSKILLVELTDCMKQRTSAGGLKKVSSVSSKVLGGSTNTRIDKRTRRFKNRGSYKNVRFSLS